MTMNNCIEIIDYINYRFRYDAKMRAKHRRETREAKQLKLI